MAFRALPTLLDAHDYQFARPVSKTRRRKNELLDVPDPQFVFSSCRGLSKTTALCAVGSAGAVPSLACSRPVKLKLSWDRSCTRVISNACDGEASESFSAWSKRASSLRPSVLGSPTAEGSNRSKLRAHRQNTEDKNVDFNETSPARNFRQHILKQVKMKLGATSILTRKQSFRVEAKPERVDKDEGSLGSREPDSQCNEQATFVKAKAKEHVAIQMRPKAPPFPGARRSQLPTATMAPESDQVSDSREIEHNEKRKESVLDESDGIYEDDGSSCDSDF